MLSKDSVKVLKYLQERESFFYKENYIPPELLKVKRLLPILEDLVSQEYVEEIGARTIPSVHVGPSRIPEHHIRTWNYRITPSGIAYLEGVAREARRTWIPVITSNAIAGLALIISIIALIKSW